MFGTATATCQNGSLDRPYCRCDKCCPKPYKYIDGISLDCSKDPVNNKKSTCNLACPEVGHTIVGQQKLKCVENSNGWDWDDTWPICQPDGTTTSEPTTVEQTTTSDASFSIPITTTDSQSTQAPVTTTVETTTAVIIENDTFIGLSKVSEALNGITLSWNAGLKTPDSGAKVASQALRVISGNQSTPKIINLSKTAATFTFTDILPGIFYQIELVVTFENGAMYSGGVTAKVENKTGLMKCAVCNSIEGNDACNDEGLVCDAKKNQICQTIVRAENKKPARYEKRCKQKIACENERAIYKSLGLCGGGSRRKMVDVCVYCCTGDMCNWNGSWAKDQL